MMAKAEDAPRDFPSRLMIAVPAAALALLAAVCVAGMVGIARVLVVTHTLLGPWAWQVPLFLGLNLLVAAGSVWGVVKLKPWKGWTGPHEPIAPATRTANRLFGLKELLTLVAALALFYGAKDPLRAFSDSQLAPGIAILVIVAWLLARALREWWGRRADEHEQRAIDFGRRVGAGVFLAITPAWWIAARGGFAPQPNAMALWILTMLTTSLAWSWHRYR